MEQPQDLAPDTRNGRPSSTSDRISSQPSLRAVRGMSAQGPGISDPRTLTSNFTETHALDRQPKLMVPALSTSNAASSDGPCSDVHKQNSSAHGFTQTKQYADLTEFEKWLGKDLLNKSRWYSRRPTLLAFNITMAMAVLGVNIWALMYFPRFKTDTEDLGTLRRGDCFRVKVYNALIHVAINILSSALLSASNFSMQILVAPTRDMIDEAHSKKRWVQVGVPSISNILRIEWYRRALWICMVLSSLPLHFLYNSVIYTTVPTNNYMWAVVNNRFLHGASWVPEAAMSEFVQRVHQTGFVVAKNDDSRTNAAFEMRQAGVGYEDWDMADQLTIFNSSRRTLLRDLQRQIVQNTTWQDSSSDGGAGFHRLERAECLLQYNKFLANNSHIFLVSSEADQNSSPLVYWGFENLANKTDLSSYWMFERTNNFTYSTGSAFEFQFRGNTHEERLAEIRKIVGGWNVATYKIDYCIASQRSLEDMCVLAYSPPLLLAICVASVVKCLGLLSTAFIAWQHRSSKDGRKLLLTLGDALQSFWKRKDEYTKGRCTMDRDDVVKKREIWTQERPPSRQWQERKRKFRNGASNIRWASTMAIYVANWLVAVAMSVISLGALRSNNLPRDVKSLFWYSQNLRDGVFLTRGKKINLPINPGTRALLTNIIFANYAQFFISVAGLLINSLFTTLHVAVEWSSYADKRKPLRVSHPRGLQEGTYFLSLPFRYAAPMQIFLVVLHWTASQSIAVISIRSSWDSQDLGADKTVSACRHSPGWVVIAMVLATLPIIGLLFAFFRGNLSEKAPVVSTCSAAISAACHPPQDEDPKGYLLPLQWGVASTVDGVEHCSLTTHEAVREPKAGTEYQ